jgi:hypothetical protein
MVHRSLEEGQRRTAFALFDADRDADGEAVWTQALASRRALEEAYERAGRAFEAALAWDAAARAPLARNLLERARFAERNHEPTRRDELVSRLELYDDDGSYRRQWNAPAQLALATDPPGADVWISRFAADARGGLNEVDARRLGVTPLAPVTLAPGSYVLRVVAPGRAPVRYPVELDRGEALHVVLALVPVSRVPDGFVLVSPGRFLYGEADEALRRLVLAPPLHERHTGAYLIGRTHVTVGDWLTFLATLPPEERARRTPGATAIDLGSVSLVALPHGRWEYHFSATGAGHAYVVRTGEPLRYLGRSVREVQDWMRFPVTGISAEDATAYTAWLDHTGQLPGARLCTGAERERAGRGADEREYPQGREPDPSETNILQTYGGSGVGLDEVGSHPATVSPFGVEDLVGSASEWTVQGAGVSDRGATYGQDLFARMQLNARSPAPPDLRTTGVGVRVCASVRTP